MPTHFDISTVTIASLILLGGSNEADASAEGISWRNQLKESAEGISKAAQDVICLVSNLAFSAEMAVACELLNRFAYRATSLLKISVILLCGHNDAFAPW